MLDRALAGRHLRVAAIRLGKDSIFAGYAVSSPYSRTIAPAGPIVSVAMAGQIAPAAGPRTNACGAPPMIQASLSKMGVAAIECVLNCRAVLTARRGRSRAKVARALVTAFGAQEAAPGRAGEAPHSAGGAGLPGPGPGEVRPSCGRRAQGAPHRRAGLVGRTGRDRQARVNAGTATVGPSHKPGRRPCILRVIPD